MVKKVKELTSDWNGKSFEQYVGAAGLKRLGKKKWRRAVVLGGPSRVSPPNLARRRRLR
jgi:hypothetical protein